MRGYRGPDLGMSLCNSVPLCCLYCNREQLCRLYVKAYPAAVVLSQLGIDGNSHTAHCVYVLILLIHTILHAG
jgi:hypothetical protein